MKTDNELIARYDNDILFKMWRIDKKVDFSEDWNALIKVLEKIRANNTDTSGCIIDISFDVISWCQIQIIRQTICKKKILCKDKITNRAVFKAIVEFIKWYNQQNP